MRVGLKIYLAALTVFLCIGAATSSPALAQRVSVSTNLVEWANLGTANAEAGVAVSQHFSLHAGFRYNNWSFRKGQPDDRLDDISGDAERQFQNRKQAYNFGFRYWPWHVYSGWWLYLRGQWQEYNRGGVFRHTAEEGDAYGAGIGFGYTYMLGKHWNVEFGIGGWGGYKTYKVYRCTNCGSVVEQGGKGFFLPDDVFVSFSFVF